MIGPMRWPWSKQQRLLDAGEKARRLHEAWLTMALSKPAMVPRIPIRAVKNGGFDRLRARPGGRSVAEAWWGEALEAPDLQPQNPTEWDDRPI